WSYPPVDAPYRSRHCPRTRASPSTCPTAACSRGWTCSSRTADTAECTTPWRAVCRSSRRAAPRTRPRSSPESPGAARVCACAGSRPTASARPSGGCCRIRPSARTPPASARRSPPRRALPASRPCSADSSRRSHDPSRGRSVCITLGDASPRGYAPLMKWGDMDMDHAAVADLEELRSRLHGDLRLPGEPGWDESRGAWQLLADQYPDAVVDAADVHDIVETVRAARALGLGVAPQSTGHAAGALSDLTGAILLRTSRLDGVSIDPVAGTARVGAGAQWGAVAAATAEHGLAPVAGMAAGVGVAGLLLGGGLGWFARSHGLASNAIVSFEAVDTQGRMLTVDEHEHPDLLWAAHGGALPVILTEVVIRLHPVPQLSAGSLMWPAERMAE